MAWTHVIEECLRPPLVCLLTVVVGLVLLRRRPKLGRTLVGAGLVLLWVFATPICGGAMLNSLQDAPPIRIDGPMPEAQAIVVLSAEFTYSPEYPETTVGPMTLQRVRYAAALQRRTGLPLLVSGGSAGRNLPTLAAMMRSTLEQDFKVPVRWSEDKSGDTWENAVNSAALLKRDNVTRILLVTSAWHMPRARSAFAAQGLAVVAAPTAFRGPAFQEAASLLPAAGGLRDSSLACHEYLGRVWYALRGR